jgi:hypothetical protein
MRNFFRRLKPTRDQRRRSESPDSHAPSQTTTEASIGVPQPAAVPAGPDYPIGVPSKFAPDGTVQPFPGNTIVSHLSPSSPFYASLLSLHAKLAASPLAPLYALLPPESWHMTVFEGVCDTVRTPGHWPKDLPVDASLAQCTAHFARKLESFQLGPAGQPPYGIVATGFSSFAVGIGVRVRLRSAEEEARFRKVRDRLAETLQVRHAHHDYYELHISLAYLLRYLNKEQKAELGALLKEHFEGMPKEFELGSPEFCTFEDMFKFDRLFYLK